MTKRNMSLGSATAALSMFLLLGACGRDTKTAHKDDKNTVPTEEKAPGLKLAYVDGDTLNANYEFLKEKRASYEKKQAAYETEMQQKEKSLQSEIMAFQKKIQEGTMTQTEGEATQKRLARQQQSLEQRHQNITAQLMKEQSEIQDAFQQNLDAFLEQYNKEKKYDFIFTYSKAGGQILYANHALNITAEVLAGMNAAAADTPAEKPAADTTQKK